MNKGNGLLEFLTALLLGHKKLVFGIALASLLIILFGIACAFYFKYLVDDILTGGLTDPLMLITGGLLVVKLFSLLLTGLRSQLLLHLSLRIDLDLVLQYLQHVLHLPVSFFGSRRVGEIIARVNDIQKIRHALSNTTVTVLFDSVMVLIGLAICFTQNSRLTVMVLVFLPIYILVVLNFNGRFKRANRRLMEQNAELQACLVEAFSGIEIIRANGLEARFRLAMERQYLHKLSWVHQLGWLNNWQTFVKGLIAEGINSLVWLIGGLQVIEGRLTLGQLITYNTILTYLINPVQNLINLQSVLQEALVAAERLVEIFEREVEQREGKLKMNINAISGAIEFRNLSFRYDGSKQTLDQINLKIRAGEKIALVGATGCGKTTLVKLLLGFYLPTAGQIFIDGHNLNDLNLEQLRRRIGYVPQESLLFSGTIRENIALGLAEATLDQIIAAAKQARIHEFIADLPLRYETIISEKGNSLSEGQKQRIAIARAIIKKPDLFILDEATSNLDPITESAVHHTLDQLTSNSTTIMIAHRLSTIVKCDRIVVLDQGKIREAGSHYELLRNQGLYYQAWQVQSQAPKERVDSGA